MVEAIRLSQTGGVDVLQTFFEEPRGPISGHVWIEHEAIGVNYLDVMHRRGQVPVPLPSGLGLEGAGRVTAVGPDVTSVMVGDRVCYALGPIGSYSTGRLYPADRLIKLPETISTEAAAAVLFKGLTAQYLLKTTYPVGDGSIILLYGAAGGVGQILAAWASHLGAVVIGVVSRQRSKDRALQAGCRHVLVWNDELPKQVEQITNGRMVDVVYDGVGAETFDASIGSLRSRGMMVSIGASSGLPAPVSIATLNAKSLFLTRPSLAAHVGEAVEYQARAADLLSAVAQGIVHPSIWRTFDLSDAAAAHDALEQGHSAGAILLKP